MPEQSEKIMMQDNTASTDSLGSDNASETDGYPMRTKLTPTETDLGKRVVFYTTLDKERLGTLR